MSSVQETQRQAMDRQTSELHMRLVLCLCASHRVRPLQSSVSFRFANFISTAIGKRHGFISASWLVTARNLRIDDRGPMDKCGNSLLLCVMCVLRCLRLQSSIRTNLHCLQCKCWQPYILRFPIGSNSSEGLFCNADLCLFWFRTWITR